MLDRSLDLVRFLRAHCPWDAAQTHHSLRRYLLDESHEVVDAIDAADDEALGDELGDLLLNVAFQIVVAEERGAFDSTAVVRGLEEKMRRRHPHLYGGEHESWDSIKAREKGNEPTEERLLDNLVPGRDALGYADRLQKRVAEVGFDWADPGGAWRKVVEEIEEVRIEFEAGATERLEEEVGDLLFAVVNFSRLAGIHPTTALSRANAKFTRRFNRLEEIAAGRGIVVGEASLEALDEVWDEVKREER